MDQVHDIASALPPSLKPANAAPSEKTLREDIRMLGRLLGDTLREQEGVATFELIENIRQYSVRFRRDCDSEAKTQLDTILNRLDHNFLILKIIFTTGSPGCWCSDSGYRIIRTIILL